MKVYNIMPVCTRHKEPGNCNSTELHKIIESISPEIIFEELSQANFEKSYKRERLITLETTAIKMYLQNHSINHILVDTYKIPDSYDGQVDYMYQRIVNNISIESRYFRNIIDELILLGAQHGFLNSNQNDNLS